MMKPSTVGTIVGIAMILLCMMPGAWAATQYSFVKSWGSYGSGTTQFNSPWGLAIDSSGYLYIADCRYYQDSVGNNRIEKYTLDGDYVDSWGTLGSGLGQFGRDSPKGVAVDSSDNILVSDPTNGRIEKFDSQGNFLTSYGSLGTGNGQFDNNEEIAIDPSGNIFVIDSTNDRVQKLDPNGNYLLQWGGVGWDKANGHFLFPEGIAVDKWGNVFVVDSYNDRVQKFDNNGTFLTKWGSSGSGPGQFDTPGFAIVDSSGNVYVLDRWNDRLQIFDNNGNYISEVDNLQQDNIRYPYVQGLALDQEGNIYISDMGNCRILKFSPDPEPATGNISVSSTPPGVEIFLDSKDSGHVTPYTIQDVTVGSHNVYVTLSGYQTPASQSVLVTASETTPVTFTLVQKENVLVPDFTANITSGEVPLTVSFTDLSLNNPTGWAWYFGDENYSVPWTEVTSNTNFPARTTQNTVVMPDGSIVLMGGYNGSKWLNDVWRSTDYGATWTQMTAHAEWSPRNEFTSVVLSDNSIVMMGGTSTTYPPKILYNDVWRSTDYGATWTQMTAHAEWTARNSPSSVVMPDGSIVLTGGSDDWFVFKNDVWRSTDYGATWTRMTANAGWIPRCYHTTEVMLDGSIVLMGGYDEYVQFANDVWRSTDYGTTWTRMTANAGWTARDEQTTVVMPDGSILLMGGNNNVNFQPSLWNDLWQSTDMGATWTQITPHVEWSKRTGQSGDVMPDGSIILIGGNNDGYGAHDLTDVWRFQPAGSLEQNPVHTYTSAGTYQVALQSSNSGGYGTTRKAGYITVSPSSKTGNITVSSTPEGAEIFLDSKDSGHVTPYTIQDVTVGSHNVYVTLSGYQTPASQSVLVTASETTSVTFILVQNQNVPEFPLIVVPVIPLIVFCIVIFLKRKT